MSKGKTKMGNIGDDWKFLLGHRGEPPHWFSENLGVWPPCGHHWFPTSHRSSLESWGHLGVLDLEPPTFVGYDTSWGFSTICRPGRIGSVGGFGGFQNVELGHHSVHVTTSAILHQQKVPENSHVPSFFGITVYIYISHIYLYHIHIYIYHMYIYIYPSHIYIHHIYIHICIIYIYNITYIYISHIYISHTYITYIYIYISHIYIYIYTYHIYLYVYIYHTHIYIIYITHIYISYIYVTFFDIYIYIYHIHIYRIYICISQHTHIYMAYIHIYMYIFITYTHIYIYHIHTYIHISPIYISHIYYIYHIYTYVYHTYICISHIYMYITYVYMYIYHTHTYTYIYIHIYIYIYIHIYIHFARGILYPLAIKSWVKAFFWHSQGLTILGPLFPSPSSTTSNFRSRWEIPGVGLAGLDIKWWTNPSRLGQDLPGPPKNPRCDASELPGAYWWDDPSVNGLSSSQRGLRLHFFLEDTNTTHQMDHRCPIFSACLIDQERGVAPRDGPFNE